jgi:hypothetical protein
MRLILSPEAAKALRRMPRHDAEALVEAAEDAEEALS